MRYWYQVHHSTQQNVLKHVVKHRFSQNHQKCMKNRHCNLYEKTQRKVAKTIDTHSKIMQNELQNGAKVHDIRRKRDSRKKGTKSLGPPKMVLNRIKPCKLRCFVTVQCKKHSIL